MGLRCIRRRFFLLQHGVEGEALIGFRVVQGVGAAMLVSSAYAIVSKFVPQERIGMVTASCLLLPPRESPWARLLAVS